MNASPRGADDRPVALRPADDEVVIAPTTSGDIDASSAPELVHTRSAEEMIASLATDDSIVAEVAAERVPAALPASSATADPRAVSGSRAYHSLRPYPCSRSGTSYRSGNPLKTTIRPDATLSRWALLAGVVVVVAAAVAAGLAAPTAPRAIALIPVAIALGLAGVALAVTRFELFVASILVVRASFYAADLGPAALDAAGALSVVFVAASAVWLLAQRSEVATPSPTTPLSRR